MAFYNLGTARGKISIDADDLKNADLSLRSAGRSAVYFGAAALAGFGYVIGVGAKFEKEMSFISAVTNASESEMQKLRQAALDLGEQGPFGPREVAAGFVDLAKAGVTAKQIIDGVGEAAINLAAAGDIPLTEAAETLVNAMTSFGLTAEEAAAAVDSIAGAANASTIDVADLAYTLKYAAAPAASLGLELGELNTAIAILGNQGIKGSRAGTSLRRVLLQLAAPTEAAKEQMESLGLLTEEGGNAFFTAEGKAKSLEEIFRLLSEATAGLNDQQRIEAFKDIFGTIGLNGALILADAVGAEWQEMTDQVGNTTAQEVARERMDNLSGAVRRLQAALESVFIKAGTPFQTLLKDLVESLRSMVLWFGNLDPKIQSFILGSVAIVGLLSLMSGVFLLTIGNMVRTVRVMAELGTSFSKLGPIIVSATRAMAGFTVSLLTNPIFLVVAALVALGYAFYQLYKNNEAFREFIDGLWQSIQKFWDNVLAFVGDVGKAISDFFYGWENGWKALRNSFSNQGITTGANQFIGVIERIGNALGDAWRSAGDFFQAIPGALIGIANSVKVRIAQMVATVRDGATRLAGSVLSALVNLPGRVGGVLSSAARSVGEFFRELPRRVGYTIGFILGSFVRLARDVPVKIVQMVTGAIKAFYNFQVRSIEAFKEWGPKVIESVVNTLTTILETAWNWANSLFDIVWDAFTTMLSTVWNVMSQIPGIIFDGLTTALDAAVSFIPKFFSFSWDMGKSIIDGISEFILGLPDLIWDTLTAAIDVFKDLVSTAFNAAKDFAGGLWDGFKDGLGINSPSFIEEALFRISDTMSNATRDLRHQVGTMQSLGARVPYVSTAAVGLGSGLPAGETHLYTAPLIGQATIRDERDARTLAREVDRVRTRKKRGRGGNDGSE